MWPAVWLGVAAAMAVVEALSQGLITMWFVAGALIAFVCAMAGAPEIAQCVVFLAVSIVLLIAVRPFALKYRTRTESAEPTLVGACAIVVEDIDNARMVGRVQTADKMSWAARSVDGSPIEAGARVVVVAQESIKLVVERG